MATPTIQDIFGTKAQVVSDLLDVTETISATNPALVIPMNGLSASGLNQVASMSKSEKVLLALLITSTAWYRADNTEEPIAEASAVRESTQTRRGGSFRGYAYEYTFFKPQPATPVVDPDLVDVLE
jgi:hypothetical protein